MYFISVWDSYHHNTQLLNNEQLSTLWYVHMRVLIKIFKTSAAVSLVPRRLIKFKIRAWYLLFAHVLVFHGFP